MARWLAARFGGPGGPRLIGVSGAQGTGKSTLTTLLQREMAMAQRPVAVLSLDDFYRPAAERARLARQVHPLLRTRGVPGTHDLPWLMDAAEQLLAGHGTTVPVFDKADDDRSGKRRVAGTGVCVVEGWCLGVEAVADGLLVEPVNALERTEDPDGRWRRYVNSALAGDYQHLGQRLDVLVYLRAPDFAASVRWRRQQEQALPLARRMNEGQLQRFMEHYERLSRRGLNSLPGRADTVVNLRPDHSLGEVLAR